MQVNMPLLLSYTAICLENSTWCQCFTGFLLFHARCFSVVSGRERRILGGSGGKQKRAPAKCSTWVQIFIPSHSAVLPLQCSTQLPCSSAASFTSVSVSIDGHIFPNFFCCFVFHLFFPFPLLLYFWSEMRGKFVPTESELKEEIRIR